ncbi:hypothetical protein [Candidatus Electronema sp. JM]
MIVTLDINVLLAALLNQRGAPFGSAQEPPFSASLRELVGAQISLF